MKTILGLWNAADKGKTDTLREFAKLILSVYPACRVIYPKPVSISSKHDFRLVVDINGIIVGVESQGDPNTNLRTRLLELTDSYKCDVILCTTRTRGDTVAAVDFIVSHRGFEAFWTSTYQIDDKSKHGLANELKAKHLLELLRAFSRI